MKVLIAAMAIIAVLVIVSSDAAGSIACGSNQIWNGLNLFGKIVVAWFIILVTILAIAFIAAKNPHLETCASCGEEHMSQGLCYKGNSHG